MLTAGGFSVMFNQRYRRFTVKRVEIVVMQGDVGRQCVVPECVMSGVPSTYIDILTYTHTQDVSRLADITAGGDFSGLCDQKSSYKHVSDFGRLRSYDRLKLRIEGNDY